jgi:hypothetical protein
MGHTSCKDDLTSYALYILILFDRDPWQPSPRKSRKEGVGSDQAFIALLDAFVR